MLIGKKNDCIFFQCVSGIASVFLKVKKKILDIPQRPFVLNDKNNLPHFFEHLSKNVSPASRLSLARDAFP